MTRAATARRLATGAAYGGGSVGLGGAALFALLREEARAARRKVEARTPRTTRPRATASTAAAAASRSCSPSSATPAPSAWASSGPPRRPGVLIAAALTELAERPVRLVRLAVSGAVSRDLDDQVDKALAEQPDVALIMIGANDVTSRTRPGGVGAPPRRRRPPADRRPAARSSSAPAPTSARSARSPSRCAPSPAGGAGRLAAAQTVAVVEAGGRTVSLGSVLGPAFASDRSMFSVDEFHPSALGYAQAAAVLLPSVADAVGRLAGRGRPRRAARSAAAPCARSPQAAARAASRTGTEVQPAEVRGSDTGPRGPWALLRRRRPTEIPTPGADGGVGGGHRRRLRPARRSRRRRYRGVVSGATRRPPTVRGPASSWRTHARSRHRRDRPLPHRPRVQGVAEGPAPRRPGRHHRARRPGQGARARPAATSTT